MLCHLDNVHVIFCNLCKIIVITNWLKHQFQIAVWSSSYSRKYEFVRKWKKNDEIMLIVSQVTAIGSSPHGGRRLVRFRGLWSCDIICRCVSWGWWLNSDRRISRCVPDKLSPQNGEIAPWPCMVRWGRDRAYRNRKTTLLGNADSLTAHRGYPTTIIKHPFSTPSLHPRQLHCYVRCPNSSLCKMVLTHNVT